MNEYSIQRLAELSPKMRAGIATKAERDEYMLLLYQNGSISLQQYRDYQTGKNTDEIINAALAIGGIVLLGYLLSRILK
jgi:hypothetical protein